jgi:hypothetical protein
MLDLRENPTFQINMSLPSLKSMPSKKPEEVSGKAEAVCSSEALNFL